MRRNDALLHLILCFSYRPTVNSFHSSKGLFVLALILAGTPLSADSAGKSVVDVAQLKSSLTLWPEADRDLLATSVAAAAEKDKGVPFATFDADGTIWSSDATESFMAYLDAQRVLVPERLEASLKIIPILPGEGIYSYYLRLCAKDKAIGYPWCAQVFAGFTLKELRDHYEAMMKTPGTKVRVWNGSAFEEQFVAVPKLWPQQVQLIHALEQCGVRVFIVTASPEELVRFLACDPACAPAFDLHLPPERIIGVNTLLQNDQTGDVTSSRLRLNKSPVLFDTANPREQWEDLRLTSFILPPVTMYAGKVAAITSFIDPTQRPVLASGDSGSDFPMLFYSAGARVWVEHPYTSPDTFTNAIKTYAGAPEPDRGWVHGTWDTKNPPPNP